MDSITKDIELAIKTNICKVIRKQLEEIEAVYKYSDYDLCGYCAIASVAIKIAFKKHGFKATLINGTKINHSRERHGRLAT